MNAPSATPWPARHRRWPSPATATTSCPRPNKLRCPPKPRSSTPSAPPSTESTPSRAEHDQLIATGPSPTTWAHATANIGRMKAGSRAAAGGLPIAEMKRWYLTGDSNQTIGQRVDLHQGTVRRVLIEAGLTMRTRREQVALNDARTGGRVPSREELVAGYIKEGLTSAELAVRFGISETRIQATLVRHGV